MIFVVCLLAGAIGASLAAGAFPQRSFVGSFNTALGVIGGLLTWTVLSELASLIPSLSTFLVILFFGGIGGALATMGPASLRNILRSSRQA